MRLPALKPSLRRIWALIGRTYEPDLLSGKIDVRQTLSPSTTSTLTEPNPRRGGVKDLIRLAASSGKVMKCQAPGPGQIQISALNSNSIGCMIRSSMVYGGWMAPRRAIESVRVAWSNGYGSDFLVRKRLFFDRWSSSPPISAGRGYDGRVNRYEGH